MADFSPVTTTVRREGEPSVDHVHPRIKKVDLADFAEGRDRVFFDTARNIYLRSRLEVTREAADCPTCGAQKVQEGAPRILPIRVSVVECEADGTAKRHDDGSLKVLAKFNAGVATANVMDPAHWSHIKARLRDQALDAVEARLNEPAVLGENLVDELSSQALMPDTVPIAAVTALSDELGQVRRDAQRTIEALGDDRARLVEDLEHKLSIIGDLQRELAASERRAADDRERLEGQLLDARRELSQPQGGE